MDPTSPLDPHRPDTRWPDTSSRRRPGRLSIVLGLLALGAAPAMAASGAPSRDASGAGGKLGESLDILVFTRTEGFEHGSISDGVSMIESIAQEIGSTVTATEETTLFTPSGLAPFEVVIWLSTTGDVLDGPEQTAFEGYIQGGGGYIGIHAAADCEYDWAWYGDLLGNGAWFESHPSIQNATLERAGVNNPEPGFPEAATDFRDEWYNFQANPRPSVTVLMTLDEDSYDPGANAMGADHPITWAHETLGGRAFYTGLGHRPETYEDSRFRAQIRNAILWASRVDGAILDDGFESGTTGAWSAVN